MADDVLTINGSAGVGYGSAVCLCAGGSVINRCTIECIPNKRIIVECRHFVSEGVIFPEPEVLVIDGTEQRPFGILLVPWSECGGE